MKKLLLFLLILIAFAPPGKAELETVRYYLNGNNSLLINTNDKTLPSNSWKSGVYKASLQYKTSTSSAAMETVDFAPTGTDFTSTRYGYQLTLTTADGTQGVKIYFTGTWDPTSATKYTNFNVSGMNRGIYLNIKENEALSMQIESLDGTPIKSVSFKANNGSNKDTYYENRAKKYLVAYVGTPVSTYESHSSSNWTYAENRLTFTPDEPTKRIAVKGNHTKEYVYITEIEWEWDVPMAAPTVKSASTNPIYAPTYADGKYTYLSDGHSLVLEAPKNGCAIHYTIDGGMPDKNSPEAPDGVIKLTGFVAGKEHIVRAVAVDSEGNVGKTLTLKCVKARVQNPRVSVSGSHRLNPNGVYDFIGEMAVRLYPAEGSSRAQYINYGVWTDGNADYLSNGTLSGQGDKVTSVDKCVALTVTEKMEGKEYKEGQPTNLEQDKTYYLHAKAREYEHNVTVDNDNYLVVPVRALSHFNYKSIADLTANSADHDGQLVVMDCPLRIQYVEKTALPNTYFLYVTDADGNAIKAVSRGNSDQPFPTMYKSADIGQFATVREIPAGGLVGRYRHNEGFFEIEVKNSDADYMPFLPTDINRKDGVENPESGYERTKVTRDDFNRRMILRYVEKVDGNHVRDSEGSVIQVIDRFETGGFPWTDADNGKRYRIDCTIGQYDGNLVVFPIKGADGHNSITEELPRPAVMFEGGNRIDESAVVNIINEYVELRFAPEVAYAGQIQYQHSNDGVNWIPSSGSCSFTVDTNGEHDLWVRSTDDTGRYSYDPVHLKFRHHLATAVSKIADFKSRFLDSNGNLNSGDISGWYRMDGDAVVELVTPYYIYARDNIATPGTRNHLLIYNANGWDKAPVVEDASAEGGKRYIEKGDVITGFALIADRTPQGNLRAKATGFARTFVVKPDADVITPTDYDDIREVDYETESSDKYYEKFTFGTDDRMMHYTFDNVRVYRRHNPDYDDPSLKEVDNGDGTVTKYHGDEPADTNIVDEYIYTLKLGPQDDAEGRVKGLDLRFNVFTGRRGGWITSYDPDRADEIAYTILGVVVRDEKRSLTGYSLAMTGFYLAEHAKAPAAIYIDGHRDAEPAEDGAIEFVYKGVVKIDRDPDADPRAVIYYTIDGTDPKTNRLRMRYDDAKGIELPADQRTVTVRTYAAWPGAAPSEEVSAKFRRLAGESQAIVNFLTGSEENQPYHFGGYVRIAAVGGDYMFVRGVAGHYLAIHRQTAAGGTNPWSRYTPGHYLTDFVVGIEKVGETVRGAKVTDEYAPYMSAATGEKPAGLKTDIAIDQPDEVTVITAANARRLVKISNVMLEGVEFEQEAEALVTEWTLIPDRGHDMAHAIAVNHTVLDYKMPEKGTEGKYYNLTGFVMLDENGVPELWPTEVERVVTATPVTASFDADATVSVPVANTYIVDFYPSTVVELKYDGPRAQEATIKYIFTDGEDAPAADDKWNVYGQPFAVTASTYIHALVEIPGMEESVHTHIDLTLGEASGTVDFDVDIKPGATTVTMTAAEGAAIYWTKDNTLPQDQWSKYEGELSFDSETRIWAYAKTGASAGAVSHMLVVVLPEETEKPEQPGDRVSGRVKFELIEGDGKVLVKISPVDDLDSDSYEIRYTTEAGVQLPEGGELYKEPGFEMTKSGLVIAVLVEKATGKPMGQTCEVSVWVVAMPTAIDSVGADGAGNVRVDGDSIIAPEGSEVYDLSGRRVRPEGLRNGIYIVRTPDGNAVKVAIR